jgi:alanyl-tRNA synthetase
MAQGVDYSGAKTHFEGYDQLVVEGSKVVALYIDGSAVNELGSGDAGIVVLDRTPFYAESGGQVGDIGELVAAGGSFTVEDTHKIQSEVFGHHGRLSAGTLKLGDTVRSVVDAGARARSAWNHSATHLMHSALRKVLGNHVSQKG